MSEQIDWSKAPEGVMGLHPFAGGYAEHWLKWAANGDSWFCVTGFESAGWVQSVTPDLENVEYAARIVQREMPRPTPAPIWNGPEDGLPPVGTELELQLKVGSTWTVWCPAKVLFCKDNALVFQWAAQEVAHPVTLNQVRWRAIKTAEQLAAEERDRGVAELMEWVKRQPVMTHRSPFPPVWAALYDAGLRAPVKP